ncbi:hypothetical protein CDD80_3127 [Ophiocordyceps camponoti-rufipedis]|uniref:Uncharacterized protein n=1 Tax=Ophiocordyceps camponoti-rufipedis TaxID=2004952 RepID=A0A2C5YPI4_9HYPO|nr:hypothetical protein CDD80_3127 [Ophiocordyceps camponoti-rufipedis]
MEAEATLSGDSGKALRNWSSLIGIVTAIVGNVLIALAINVQRYAHTRLHKERVRVRRRARAAVKRAQSSSVGSYGAIGRGDSNGHFRHDVEDNGRRPLTASYHSTATTNAGDGAGDDDDDESDDCDARRRAASTYLKSPYWWLGQILITLGEMGNFLAYGFAPASIVSPLGVVALVSNCIIAPVMFHEAFRVRDFWGVVIAVAGVVTVVLSAKQEETKLGPHEVWEAITTTAFEIYMAVTMCLIILLVWASGRYGKRTILIDLGLVGLFGGYTALATKGVSSMLSSTLWRAFTTPVTYVLILILLVTAVMQIRYVNKALQRFDSTQVIPIQFVLFTLSVILGSAILYRDFEKTTGEQAAKFIGGCLLTFFGVFLITTGRQQQEDEDEDDGLSDADNVEETIGLTQQGDTIACRSQEASSRPRDVPPSQSRRSSRLSRVSFAETLIKPTTPPASEVPTIQLAADAAMESAPDLRMGEESTPLVSNPWRESDDEDGAEPPPLPPRGLRTLSADAALTAGSSSSHQGLLMATRASPLLHSRSDHPVTPRSQHMGGSWRAGSQRRSKMFISPSPLSSTVTTVVKDAFLGGYNSRSLGKRSSFKRLRSSIRASLFFADDEDDEATRRHEHENNSHNDDDDDDDDQGDGARPSSRVVHRGDDNDQTRRRSRSVSDTLGDLFRPSKKKKACGSSADGG